ncbi:hypothetical protein JCM14719A_01290 [Calditerricola satsumensis]|uniref:Uncharacterized protein n=1 Tax=Calditerricola satsumensis TaxID=373054 RepID=A0A8J3BJL1_9BACI|nr:hypothetical protein GCM10007043_22710 [Calditerricola satsumensis]
MPDYVGGPGGRTTHVSLNHHVANMNYLYETYLTDQNPQKRALANLYGHNHPALQHLIDEKNRWLGQMREDGEGRP